MTKQCIHKWEFEPPSGPVSKGVCKLCGEEAEQPNYFADYTPGALPAAFWDDLLPYKLMAAN